MSWPFDPTEPHVTPERFLDYYCRREGVTREQLRLPSTLVATFQRGSFARFVEQTGAKLPLEIETRPGSAGLGSGFLVGRTPRTGQDVAVARLSAGAPATALALEIAIARGVREILVCGSAGSLQPDIPMASTVIVIGAEREEGTSHHYLPAGEPAVADPDLSTALEMAARELTASPTVGRSWTIDAFFRETAGAIERHRAAGVAVVEMEAAAIFAVAKVRGVWAGLIVAVSDELFHPWNPGFHLPEYVAALTRAADATVRAAASIASHE
ncbi:MAG: nucleoside phosphorylase [Chloroflexota bacterium]